MEVISVKTAALRALGIFPSGCLFMGLVLAAGLGTHVWAQFTTARLSGTVVDPSGLALVGATVTVQNELTAYKQDTTTSSSGEYLVPVLPVGNYQITVTMTGFVSYTQKGITLQVDKVVTLPGQMKLGTVAQQVTVRADASMVTTDSATVGQLITQKEVAELPLNGRYAQQLVFLVPGADNVTANYCAANCEGGSLPQRAMCQGQWQVFEDRVRRWFPERPVALTDAKRMAQNYSALQLKAVFQ